MTSQNVLITGTPRSGTTLTCHLLNKLPETVALPEPMKVKHFLAAEGAGALCQTVRRFCDDQRRSILEHGRAVSNSVDGALVDNPFAGSRADGAPRRLMAAKGQVVIDKPLSPAFTLVLKHNSMFTAALGDLVGCFPVYAVVRNPLATLASWSSVGYYEEDGKGGGAERLDADLGRRLAAIADHLDRQIFLLGWFHEQFRRYLPEPAIIRYETIVESGGRALDVVRPEAASLSEPMENRNANPLYDHAEMIRRGERLLQSDGPHWAFYPRASVERLLNELATPTSG